MKFIVFFIYFATFFVFRHRIIKKGKNMEKECKGTIHKVVAGDTLYKISKLYGVRLVDVLKENPYVNVYNLQPGDEICVPTEIYEEREERRYFTARTGETLKSITEETGADIQRLFEYNKELMDMRIPLGTIIRIPPEINA